MVASRLRTFNQWLRAHDSAAGSFGFGVLGYQWAQSGLIHCLPIDSAQ